MNYDQITHLSYSSVNKYTNCPKSWKFRYIDGVRGEPSESLVLGSIVHKVIEAYMLDRSLDILTDAAEGVFPASVTAEYENESMYHSDMVASFFKIGELQTALQGIKPKVLEDGPAVEMRVEFPAPGIPIPIIGYIDVLTEDNIIVDFKTSKRSWNQSEADNKIQASFYAASLYLNGMIDFNSHVNVKYVVLVKNKKPKIQVIDTVRTFQDITHVFNMVNSTWDSIKKGAFHPNPNTYLCSPKYCDAWGLCEGGRIA